MSRLPSMPFFPADFFADTERVSAEAAKAYLFLLGHAWLQGGNLPNDAKALARMARVGPKLWAAISGDVLSFWDVGADGRLRNNRLTKEYAWVSRRKEINQKNGLLGGRPKTQNQLNLNTSLKPNGFFSETDVKPPTLTLNKEDSLNVKKGKSVAKMQLDVAKKPQLAGGVSKMEKRSDRIFNEVGTPQWNAWQTVYLKKYGEPLLQIQHYETKKLGWYFPTEWPPKIPES